MARSRPEMIDVALAVAVRSDRRVLVALRDERDELGGLWEFPGGKLQPGEPADRAALRELEEETGLRCSLAEPLLVFVHDYPDRAIRFHCFVVRDPRGEVVVDRGRRWAWVTREELDALEMPPANMSILRALGWRLAGSDSA